MIEICCDPTCKRPANWSVTDADLYASSPDSATTYACDHHLVFLMPEDARVISLHAPKSEQEKSGE